MKRGLAPFNILCVAQDVLIATFAAQVTSKEPDHEMPQRVAIPLLERLLASPVVPVDAKLAAINSCRRKLAEMDWGREQRVLDARLAEAARTLKSSRT
jgi:hypothetical protein